MPTTREFKAKTKSAPQPASMTPQKEAKAATANAKTQKTTADQKETEAQLASSAAILQTAEGVAPKRRPGRTETETSTTPEVGMQTETRKAEDIVADFEAPKDQSKVEINFAGSELLRSRFPKPFEVAEAVATAWSGDAKFDHLPISHPLANWAAQKGLLKAKELEKKVSESPHVEKAAMAALTMAMKAQTTFEQLRSRLKRS